MAMVSAEAMQTKVNAKHNIASKTKQRFISAFLTSEGLKLRSNTGTSDAKLLGCKSLKTNSSTTQPLLTVERPAVIGGKLLPDEAVLKLSNWLTSVLAADRRCGRYRRYRASGVQSISAGCDR